MASSDGTTECSPAAEPSSLAPTLEALAFDAWPASEVAVLGGWRLRFHHGVTNRANSVWPNQATGPQSLEERFDAVERFYAERGQDVRYQISPAARPSGLDAALELRGYSIYAPVCMETAKSAGVAEALGAATAIETQISETLGEEWFGLSGRRGRYEGAAARHYRSILERCREQPAYALARIGGKPVAVGLAVARNHWAGIFSMLTVPDSRRSGAGRAILAALARWAAETGRPDLYLQVESENAPARRLYEAAGFRVAYRNHYRRRSDPTGGE